MTDPRPATNSTAVPASFRPGEDDIDPMLPIEERHTKLLAVLASVVRDLEADRVDEAHATAWAYLECEQRIGQRALGSSWTRIPAVGGVQ